MNKETTVKFSDYEIIPDGYTIKEVVEFRILSLLTRQTLTELEVNLLGILLHNIGNINVK